MLSRAPLQLAAGGGGRWQRRGEKVALYFTTWQVIAYEEERGI